MSFFNAVVDNLSGRAIGLAFDKKYSADRLADDWINDNGDNRMKGFSGTKDALDQRIADTCNDCAAYVHDKNWQVSTKTAVSTCRNKVEQKYAKLITAYGKAQAAEEAQAKTLAFQSNSKLIIGIVSILAVLLTIVVILRIKNK